MDLMDIDTAIEESFPTNEDEEVVEKDDETTEEDDSKDGDKSETEEEGEKEAEKEDEKEEEKKDDDSEEEEDEKTEKKPPEKKARKENKVQKRFDEMTRERYQLRKENEELRRRLESREPEIPEQPDPKKFKNQRDYDFAMGQWQAKVEVIKHESEQREQTRIQNETQQYQAKIQSEKSKYEDFDRALQNIAHIDITPELHDALYHSDNATQLLYFLGKNPSIAEDVLSMSSHKQSRKLAEISIKLKNAGKKKKVVSDAPKPPAKVKKGSGTSPAKNIDNMSFEEHCQLMRKEEAKKIW
jgi:hypothetical protein